MSNEFEGFGYSIPSIEDERDYTIDQFIPGEDTIVDKRFCLKLPKLEIITNQGTIGACVPFSLATCHSLIKYQSTNKWIDFCPFMLYGDRLPDDHQGKGMRPAEALYTIHKKGMWFKRDFNVRKEVPTIFVEVKKTQEELPHLVKQALNYRISGYSKLNTINDIKTALKANMPVNASWSLYDSFFDTKSDGVVKNPDTATEGRQGGHAMTIIGWTITSWIVSNSWGVAKGYKGLYYIPFAYEPREAWGVSTDIYPIKKKATEIKITVGTRSILIDGVSKELDVTPVKLNDRVYVPIRVVSEALGASVEWKEDTKEVIIRSEEAVMHLVINNSTMTVDNIKYSIDVPPIAVDNRVLLPIRFISEYLNCNVSWKEDLKLVTITSK